MKIKYIQGILLILVLSLSMISVNANESNANVYINPNTGDDSNMDFPLTVLLNQLSKQ